MRKNKLVIGFLIVIMSFLSGLIILKLTAFRYKDSFCLITQLSSKLLDLNTISIQTSKDLDKVDFKIKNLNSDRFVYENGEFKKGMKNEYGICIFNIYYKDSLLFEIGHEKLNSWHTNDYIFNFDLIGDTIVPTLIIKGLDRDNGNLYYKRFDRNQIGLIYKIDYFDKNKRIYNIEIIK
jgi:hypothetical protein